MLLDSLRHLHACMPCCSCKVLTPYDGLLAVINGNEVGRTQPGVVWHKLADAVQLQPATAVEQSI